MLINMLRVFVEICSIHFNPLCPCLNIVAMAQKPSGLWSIVLDPIEVLCLTIKSVDVSSMNKIVAWLGLHVFG